MLRHSGDWQCGRRQACAMVAACKHSFSERGCSGRPCMRCAEMRLGRSRLCAHVIPKGLQAASLGARRGVVGGAVHAGSVADRRSDDAGVAAGEGVRALRWRHGA